MAPSAVTLAGMDDGARIERVAREALGFAALRPGQREAIEAALAAATRSW